jgi:uncharacterized protein (DUF433 family)
MSFESAPSRDPRDAPAYSLSDAAHYLRLPVATLRSWAMGREYPTAQGAKDFSPLLKPAAEKPAMLSFSNLIEAHVLKSLRTDHGVPVKALRAALQYAQDKLGVDRLLLSPELRANAGSVFLDRYGELIELSASGQLAMRKVLEFYLSRLDWDERKFPIRLYPFVSGFDGSAERRIVIDPRISFGRPVLVRKGVSTAAIAGRIDAGESVDDIAADYDLDPKEIEQAALYERAA